MFGFRTPAKKAGKSIPLILSSESEEENSPRNQAKIRSPLLLEFPTGPTRPKPTASQAKGGIRTDRSASAEALGSPAKTPVYANKAAEAKACLFDAKVSLGNARNLKVEIRKVVALSLNRLYNLVKEAEAATEKSVEGNTAQAQTLKQTQTPLRTQATQTQETSTQTQKQTQTRKQEQTQTQIQTDTRETQTQGTQVQAQTQTQTRQTKTQVTQTPTQDTQPPREKERYDLIAKIDEQNRLIKECSGKIEGLKADIGKQISSLERPTYAGVVAAGTREKRFPERPAALHSVMVSSSDEQQTGDSITTQIREALKLKNLGFKIEKIRKVKDRKVILGCKNEAERDKLMEGLTDIPNHMSARRIQNKDPLIIMWNVRRYNTDKDVEEAIKNHNELSDTPDGAPDIRAQVRFWKKAKNPDVGHVVVRVSPQVWQKLTEAGSIYVNMQKARVEDYSPLVQCSICLGYGHGRRHCVESIVKCSHCGGPHTKTECEGWLANGAPSCINCSLAKMDLTEHNAFSQVCPIRRKWDTLARASHAYS